MVITINTIFAGMLFVFLNFNIEIGASKIGLIPGFLGYYFMLRGLTEIEWLSDKFTKVKPFVTVMIIFSGIAYALDLFGLPTEATLFIESIMIINVWTSAIAFIAMIFSLYISYTIIMGIKDIEITKEQVLNSGRLYSTWKLVAVFSVLTFALLIIPILLIACMIINLVVGIYYLYIFYETTKLFNAIDFIIGADLKKN